MSIYRVLNEVLGRKTHGNPITLPSGSAITCKNWECIRDNVYRIPRGRTIYDTKGLPAQNVNQLLSYDNKLIAHFDDNSLYKDNGSGLFTQMEDVSGGLIFSSPASDFLMQDIEFDTNWYCTSSKGILKLDSMSSNIREAGVPKGLGFDLRIIDDTNWLTNGNTVAYRVVWSYLDANSNMITGAPSERIEVTNSAGVDRAVELRIQIPDEITTFYKLQIYRSSEAVGTPPEDLQLVYENKPTSAEITAGIMTVNDILPSGFRGADLYTNTTQEGIAQANERPPLAKTMDKYKEYVIYGNVKNLERLFTNLISVSNITSGTSTIVFNDGTNSFTLGFVDENNGNAITNCADNGSGLIRVTCAGHGYVTGEYVRIYGVTGTVEANGIWAITRIDANNFDLIGSTFTNAYIANGTIDMYEDYGTTPRAIKYTTGTDSQNIDNTARSIVKCCNLTSVNTFLNAYYVSGAADPVGKMSFFAKDLGQAEFYLIVNSSATGGNFTPVIPTSGTTYNSESDNFQHAIMWSKKDQAEAVPLINIKPIGNKGDPILKVVGLVDSVFIFKQNDGVYRLTGDSPSNWTVDVFDNTLTVLQRNSIAKGENGIFAYADAGFINISSSGVEIIGRDNEYKDLQPSLNTYFEADGYGWFYETEKSYFCSTHNTTSSTDNDIVHVWNTYTRSWRDEEHGVYTNDTNIRAARVVNNLTYYAPLTGSTLLKERKSYTITDYATPDIELTITAIDTVTNIVTLNTAVTILLESALVQGTYRKTVVSIIDTTHIELSNVNNLTANAATIKVGILSELKYQACHCGLPETNKMFKNLYLLFDNDETEVKNLIVETYTDLEKTATEVLYNTLSSEYWGKKWGVIWGLKKLKDLWRLWFTKNHSRGTMLYITIKHRLPEEQVALCGYSVEFEPVTERIQA